MAKVKIQGNASGTGVLTVTAPNTSTDRTITLPDSTGTILDENSSLPAANLTGTIADARFPATLPAISGANLTNLPASGITQADTWRLTTSFTGNVNPMAGNWERDDNTGWGKVGTGMSVDSSGHFAFPETGIYLIEYHMNCSLNGDSRSVYGYIMTTTNLSGGESTWINRAEANSFIQQTQSNVTVASAKTACILDVTNTSECKVRFNAFGVNTSRTVNGNTSLNTTFVTFIRLGDT